MKTQTFSAKSIDRKWYLIDAENLVLGRLSSYIATILKGKHKASYSPHLDMGDHVVVINASKVALTKNKATNKIYYRHTGHPGGIKFRTTARLFAANKADFIIKKAVERMLSRNPLGRSMLSKLRVYNDNVHPHTAQKLETLDFGSLNRKNIYIKG